METSAEPGGIVISYETYALVRDIVSAEEAERIRRVLRDALDAL